MRHTLPSFLVVTGLLLLTSCSGCDPKKETSCGGTGDTCSVAGDCCSDFCDATGKCAPAPTCGGTNAACSVDADCCTANGLTCQGSTCQAFVCKGVDASCINASECCATPGLTCFNNKCASTSSCKSGADTCATSSQCCNGAICDAHSQTPTNKCSANACIQDGVTCNADEPCCSGACDTATNKCAPSGGFCRDPGAHCSTGSQCCSGACDTQTATCKAAKCLPTPEPCTDPSQCCSGTGSCGPTTSGVCEVLPPGTIANDSCKTLGESCAVGTDCCSTNCKDGACVSAYYCNASGDICYQGSDCCSGTCDLSNTTSLAGRCVRPNGGCIQDGNPCSGNSGCCTRLCADPGSGVTVCMSAPGCSMTGAYCDSTQDCCGGYGDAMRPAGYGITCESSTSDPAQRCNNGQACNPPGNICGVSRDVNASQNCCMPDSWTGSGKPACKQDEAGIWRCFGAPNIPDVNTKCPTGYDGTNPECCIADGQACEINAQCCNGETCSQDATTGTFKCTSANDACLPAGTGCASGGTPCCSPYACTYLPEFGSICAQEGQTGCTQTGTGSTNACSTDGECCQHICDPTGHCALCRPTNDACTTGAECCGGICDMGVCRDPVCLPAGSDCSAAGSTCCTGYTCETTPEFGKVCTIKSPDTNCAALTTSCATKGCCFGYCTPDPTGAAGNVCETCKSNGDTCANGTQCCTGVCDPNTFKCVDQCFAEGAGCSYTGDCCSGLTCYRPIASKPGQCVSGNYCAPFGGGCDPAASPSDCCSGLVCNPSSLSCEYPATCATDSQGCGANAADPKCCTGTGLSCMTVDPVSGNPVACTTADTGCTCIVPPAACKTENQACDAANPCCTGTNLSCVSGTCQLPATCATPVGATCSPTKACCATDGTYCAETAPTNSKASCSGTSTTCVCVNPG